MSNATIANISTILNTVQIDKTFRVVAESQTEAVKTTFAKAFNKDLIIAEVLPVVAKGFENVFLVKSGFEGKEDQNYDVFFVERVGGGYRVEIGATCYKFNEAGFLWFTQGDQAVNDECRYMGKVSRDSGILESEIITFADYQEQLSYWIESDKKEGTPKRMENYIKNRFKKVVCVNGVFLLAD